MDELTKLWVLFLDRDKVISYQCDQAGQLGWFAYTRDFFVSAFGILDIFTPILLVTDKAVIGKGHYISSQQLQIIIKINLDLLRHNSKLFLYLEKEDLQRKTKTKETFIYFSSFLTSCSFLSQGQQ